VRRCLARAIKLRLQRNGKESWDLLIPCRCPAVENSSSRNLLHRENNQIGLYSWVSDDYPLDTCSASAARGHGKGITLCKRGFLNAGILCSFPRRTSLSGTYHGAAVRRHENGLPSCGCADVQFHKLREYTPVLSVGSRSRRLPTRGSRVRPSRAVFYSGGLSRDQ